MVNENPETKSKAKANNMLSDPDEETREKLRIEVDLLKTKLKNQRLQLIMAVLSAVGVVIAFVVVNFSQLKEIITPKSAIRLVVEDQLLLKMGEVTIVSLKTDSPETVVVIPAKKATDWITLEPGSFNLVLTIGEEEVYSEKVFLRAGEREPIIIPSRDTGNIRVFVQNHTRNPIPGAVLDISVDSSGNGYLWVFDHKNGQYKLIYPDLVQTEFYNKIDVGTRFKFPDKNDIALMAGEEADEEKLLFVVTSSNDYTFASKIATRMSKNIVSKASSGKSEENWGAAEIVYQVGR